MKAFLVNRVGDFGFILGIGLIAAYAGTLNYAEAFAKTAELGALTFPGTDWMLVTVICICLFIGAMGKSAQFPLHVWLPDSMEGPTPISALIHAATMVTAGIFMVARMSPLFELSDTALNFIMVIGSITALFMGFLGIIQNDIKRVVAYSTLSQLGYMTVALGASAYSVAVFHLMTHAFFKALLFLGAGSVIMGMHHNQDIRWMGGVRKYMPITWITSLLGSLALIGTPFFSGFYSKDSIIEAVHESHLAAAGFANFAVLAGVFVTAFYSFRMYFLVFHGKERYDQNPDAHHGHDDHGHGHDDHHEPHESPWVVTVPLVLLAIPSVVIGFMAIEPMLFGEFFKDVIFVNAEKHPAMKEMAEMFHGPVAMAAHALSTAPFWLALAGVVVSWYMYLVNPKVPAFFARVLRPVIVILENKYFLDWINENILARGARLLGTGLWKVGDRALIDGLVVNGSWKVVGLISGAVRRFQSGYLYHYALVMILGVFALMTYFVWLA
jgi:NADH-quinone oxidoreductase subunit L